MPTKIKFQSKINQSVSVGDLLYVIIPTSNVNAVASSAAANSVITEVGEDFVVIAGNPRLASPAAVSHFYYARKPLDNNASLKGYVLQARLKCNVSAFDSYDNSNKKLFSLGSEVTQSSK